MSGFIVSPEARRDVKEIWRYSYRQWGELKADIYIRDLNQFLLRLSDRPDRGKACDHIRASYNRVNFKSHAIFYRIQAEGILIVRILHQSMDFQRHV